jgi:SLOG cluster2/TIR domain
LSYEPTPVRVFVVWHPRYAGGEAAFRGLYDWLGGPNRDLYRRGLGVPVHAWTSASDESPPPKIPIEDQILTIIVPILDGELLGRKLWRDWVAECGETPRRSERSTVILPWAVHQAAALIPGIGLLHLVGSGDCDTRQLCRRVTEACVVRIRDPNQPRAIRIFISYARRDGSAIAGEVRRALQHYGHLSVFLDEHDLQPGQQWREGLASELSQGAAMFAVVTDAYASRAWCREELREFREPRRDEGSNLWQLRPVYILDSLSGTSTRSMFEVGNAPAARWNPERADDVVDNLIREMLFAEVNHAGARMVGGREGVQFINWVPDTWTLLQILRLGQKRKTFCIAYPGDGLPRIELDRLTQVFPGLSLVSFEELRREARSSAGQKGHRRGTPQPTRSPVLLSVSDPAFEDLARRGMRSCHLDDAAIRIARALLFDDFDVMYGGRPREGFTAGFQDDSGAVVVEARLINYLGWPYKLALTAEQVADGFGVTRYIRVPWPGEDSAVPGDPWAVAESATHTRKAIVRGGVCDLDGCVVPRPAGLIAFGGQMGGFAGFLPGIAEEIAVALEEGVAVYVLGGFGGAAEQVAAVMSGSRSEELTVDNFMRNPKYRELREAAEVRGRADELSGRLEWLWGQLRRSDLQNGLTKEENTLLWSTANVGLAVALASKGLRRIDPRHRPSRV